MTTFAPTPVPAPPRAESSDAARTMLTRLLEVAGLLCIPTVISLLAVASPTHRAISFLSYYKPLSLFTRPQTLIGSAFYLPNVQMVGITTVFTVALFTPYVLARGMGWSVRVFLTGHVISTLTVALVVIPGDALGWRTAIHIVHSSDVGASAGLAACAGGLAVVVGRKWRPLGVVLLAGISVFFVHHLVVHHGLNRLADYEHLIALAAGVMLEAWWLPHNGGVLWPRWLGGPWSRPPRRSGAVEPS